MKSLIQLYGQEIVFISQRSFSHAEKKVPISCGQIVHTSCTYSTFWKPQVYRLSIWLKWTSEPAVPCSPPSNHFFSQEFIIVLGSRPVCTSRIYLYHLRGTFQNIDSQQTCSNSAAYCILWKDSGLQRSWHDSTSNAAPPMLFRYHQVNEKLSHSTERWTKVKGMGRAKASKTRNDWKWTKEKLWKENLDHQRTLYAHLRSQGTFISTTRRPWNPPKTIGMF